MIYVVAGLFIYVVISVHQVLTFYEWNEFFSGHNEVLRRMRETVYPKGMAGHLILIMVIFFIWPIIMIRHLPLIAKKWKHRFALFMDEILVYIKRKL